jgi:hypothetical protein
MPPQQAIGQRYFGGPYAGAFQDATNASTAMAREDFQRDQGRVLGGLAKTGALRSGRARTALNDLSQTFGRQVGNIAASNAGQLAQLEAQRAEGDANRGVDRERIASSDRQADGQLSLSRDRLGFDRQTSDRDFAYRGARDDVADSRYRDETAYGRGRDQRADTIADDERNYGRGRDRLMDERDTRDFTRRVSTEDREFGYRGERDRVGDARDTRDYDRRVTEGDREFSYRGERDRVGDQRDARDFEYGRGRDSVADARDSRDYNRRVTEGDREFGRDDQRYQQERADQMAAAQRARRTSTWGTIGRIAGAGIGFAVGGPAGAMAGANLAGAVTRGR